MNKLLLSLFRFAMLPVTDADGGGPVDRGDEIVADEPGEKLAQDSETLEQSEPEEAAEEEPEEPARDEKGRFIPKSRFDEQVGKEREARVAAEQRAAALEKQINESQQTQQQSVKVAEIEAYVSELEEKHAQLLLDGEAKKAAAVMKDIRNAERQIVKAELQQDSGRITAQAIEAERVEYAIATLESEHPEFNPDSEEFDETLVNFALAEQQRLMKAEGLSPSKALIKASNSIIKLVNRQVTAQADKQGLAKAQGDRKAAQVAKNLETQKKQPASMRDSGIDSDKAGHGIEGVDPSKLTFEEFKALPESTKAKLRGDFV